MVFTPFSMSEIDGYEVCRLILFYFCLYLIMVFEFTMN